MNTQKKLLEFLNINPEQFNAGTMTIIEKPEYYQIEILNDYAGEFYKIGKQDMLVYDEVYEEMEPPEDDVLWELK